MTSNLFEKYKESLAAAESLQKEHYYSSTVNRAYYGCFQFLLDIIFTRLNVKRTDFESQRRQNKEGTHGWASKLIELELAHKDRQGFKWYQKKFPEFQKLREKADYSDDKITQDQSFDSIRTAEAIISCVNKHIRR